MLCQSLALLYSAVQLPLLEAEVVASSKAVTGEVEHRSPYLPHAKRALYHLSYIPCPLLQHFTL